MKSIYTLLLLVALVATATESFGRQRPTNDPGYIDTAIIEAVFQSEATLEVNLSGSLLRMVAEATREDDRGLYELLGKIKGIYVRGYTLGDTDALAIGTRFSDIAGRLVQDGWERVVRVRDSEETVHVLVRALEDRIDGLAVLVASAGENETVFVNIVGEIRPDEIARIGRRFQIDVLEDL